jgi:hypothetical protein
MYMAPTLVTACTALPPVGANFGVAAVPEPWGSPAENCTLTFAGVWPCLQL